MHVPTVMVADTVDEIRRERGGNLPELGELRREVRDRLVASNLFASEEFWRCAGIPSVEFKDA